MYRLSDSDISEINQEIYEIMGDGEQGVYKQPNGIPTDVKGHVIYLSWVSGGMHGGSYRSDSCLVPREGDSKPKFYALDKVLAKIAPNVTFLQYREIENLIKETENREYPDYYGNYEECDVEYIILEDLYTYLETL